jgi:NADH-quinone oxidoreductase subunit A
LLAEYGSVALYLIVAFGFTLLMVSIPVFLRLIKMVPHKPNPTKNSTFECGMETIGKAWVRFNFRYYFFALMFVALDVMLIFLYPWAVGLKQGGVFALVAMVVFVFFILIGYLYAWKKKVLEWK